jgi:hypothetical protein
MNGSGVFTTPRMVPGRIVPALGGTGVIVLALPLFAVAGWPIRGWVLAAVLWVAGQALAALLTRLPLDPSNVAAAAMRGIGTSFRGFAAGVVLVAVTAAHEDVGLAALLVYALAFTLEFILSLMTYFGAETSS